MKGYLRLELNNIKDRNNRYDAAEQEESNEVKLDRQREALLGRRRLQKLENQGYENETQ
jgi:hypothetical protein